MPAAELTTGRCSCVAWAVTHGAVSLGKTGAGNCHAKGSSLVLRMMEEFGERAMAEKPEAPRERSWLRQNHVAWSGLRARGSYQLLLPPATEKGGAGSELSLNERALAATEPRLCAQRGAESLAARFNMCSSSVIRNPFVGVTPPRSDGLGWLGISQTHPRSADYLAKHEAASPWALYAGSARTAAKLPRMGAHLCII
jgi:hypothetical protein